MKNSGKKKNQRKIDFQQSTRLDRLILIGHKPHSYVKWIQPIDLNSLIFRFQIKNI